MLKKSPGLVTLASVPTTVLYPGCPLCGQNILSPEWLKTVGERPVSIAHVAVFGRRSIERRELPLGERAPDEAVTVVGHNEHKRAIFHPAGGRAAPEGWPEQLKRAFVRTAAALGFDLIDKNAQHGLDDVLRFEEFMARAHEYLAEAEAQVRGAEEELEFRRKEVNLLAERFSDPERGA